MAQLNDSQTIRSVDEMDCAKSKQQQSRNLQDASRTNIESVLVIDPADEKSFGTQKRFFEHEISQKFRNQMWVAALRQCKLN